MTAEKAEVKEKLEVYDGLKGVLFSPDTFKPAVKKSIDSFEALYNVKLCSGYLQFLKTRNGLVCDWYNYDSEIDIQKGAYQKENEYAPGSFYTQYSFYEELNKLTENWDWPYEVSYIFGLGCSNPYCNMTDFYPEGLFYHNNLYQYAYLVGVDGGGNSMVQIAQGKIAMVDHEVASPMIEWASGTQNEETYKVPYGKATADEFLMDALDYGGLTLFDMTFDQFLSYFINKNNNSGNN